MTDEQYRAFLDLMMCADPWPCPRGEGQSTLSELADQEAKVRGYENWIIAYHEHPRVLVEP